MNTYTHTATLSLCSIGSDHSLTITNICKHCPTVSSSDKLQIDKHWSRSTGLSEIWACFPFQTIITGSHDCFPSSHRTHIFMSESLQGKCPREITHAKENMSPGRWSVQHFSQSLIKTVALYSWLSHVVSSLYSDLKDAHWWHCVNIYSSPLRMGRQHFHGSVMLVHPQHSSAVQVFKKLVWL